MDSKFAEYWNKQKKEWEMFLFISTKTKSDICKGMSSE